MLRAAVGEVDKAMRMLEDEISRGNATEEYADVVLELNEILEELGDLDNTSSVSEKAARIRDKRQSYVKALQAVIDADYTEGETFDRIIVWFKKSVPLNEFPSRTFIISNNTVGASNWYLLLLSRQFQTLSLTNNLLVLPYTDGHR